MATNEPKRRATRSPTRRVCDAPAFVLHTVPWRETSLIVELLTREHGRIACVAKGAKRPYSALRGVLLAFQPILIGFSGGHELRTLSAAQWFGGMVGLQGDALLCGFYLNELLVRLLPRDDPAPLVFDAYAHALAALGLDAPREAALRRFECVLLRELGYGLDFLRDVAAHPITGPQFYSMAPGGGLMVADGADPQAVSGYTLLDIAQGRFDSERTLLEAKRMNRMLLNTQLSGQPLKTRQILLDLHKL